MGSSFKDTKMKRTIVIFFLGIFLCLSIKALELDEPDVGITDFDENEGKTEDQLEEAFEIFQRGAVYDAQSGKRRYDNYQVISVNPQTEEHLDVLQFLEGAKGMIEMWSTIPYNASLVDRVDIVVNPKHEEHVKSYLTCAGMTPTVVEKDLQKAIDQENQVESIGTRDSTATPDLRFKRGTTFSDFLRGLLLEYPEPQTIRQSRNLKPSTIVTPPQPEGKCGYTGMN